MINEIKMGVPSVIRDVLKVTPKETTCDRLLIGEYFEYDGRIYVNIDGRHAFDYEGIPRVFFDEKVRPVKVKIEYDYVLLKEDGTEAAYL